MPREDAATKARRLLAEGRLTVEHVDRQQGIFTAKVRGDTALIYDVQWDEGRQDFTCTCIARRTCSHIKAMQLVVVR